MTDGHHGDSAKRDKVVQIINSVVSQVETSENISREAIFQEINALQDVIDQVRRDLGGTGAADINQKHIPTATDELDAVVEATAIATGEIMDACEAIQDKSAEIEGEQGEAIASEVMKIYEACSFQDITGQRITKVVSSLKIIEEKVGGLLSILGEKIPGIDYVREEEATGDAALLNGPQLPNQGVTQDDIDALLDDLFD